MTRKKLRKHLPLLLTASMLLFGGCSLSLDRVAIPLDTTIAQIGVGIQPFPTRKGWTLARLSPVWWDNDRVLLINLGLVSGSYANDGLTLNGVTVAEHGFGLSVSPLLDWNGDHAGVRVGAITGGGRQAGLQLGALNLCSKDSNALQIGLLNWNGHFLFPLVNIAVGSSEAESESQPDGQ